MRVYDLRQSLPALAENLLDWSFSMLDIDISLYTFNISVYPVRPNGNTHHS